MVSAARSAEKRGGKALGSMLRAVRQTPLTAMLSPVLRRAVSAGAAMVIRVAPAVGVMARSVPVVSIKPVNMVLGYPISCGAGRCWPGIVEVAGDTGIWTVCCSGDAVEGLLEEVRRCDALRKGNRLIAQLGFGVDEDGLVY